MKLDKSQIKQIIKEELHKEIFGLGKSEPQEASEEEIKAFANDLREIGKDLEKLSETEDPGYKDFSKGIGALCRTLGDLIELGKYEEVEDQDYKKVAGYILQVKQHLDVQRNNAYKASEKARQTQG